MKHLQNHTTQTQHTHIYILKSQYARVRPPFVLCSYHFQSCLCFFWLLSFPVCF
jgi:hypothetical protein